jgi:aminoglycoside phosphotransferase (APT) family kinase protein
MTATVPPIDEASDVREEERIDPEKLRPFLEQAFSHRGDPVSVLQFRKGHSNLTYLLRYGDDEAVLRRAPFGVKVKTAHDMRREFTILSALQGAYDKAPRPIAFCDDESVIGARFYLMERRRGVVLRGEGGDAKQFPPELLKSLSTALVENLADLHAVDVTRPALAAIGHPQGYVARQVEGWTARYANAKTDEIEDIEAVARWVNANLPAERGAAVVHNDYKYDNVMLDPADMTRIVAVLDWEMATVGDPLLDLGTLLGYWSDPEDPPEMRARPYGPTFLPGSLSRKGLVEAYARKTGSESFSPLFYYVFALFKIAVIVQQIYKRYVEGSTSDPRFRALGQWVRVLGMQAALALDKGRIDRLGTGS